MNPFLLLLGMLGASAIGLGSSGKEKTSNGNGNREKTKETDTSRDETDTSSPTEEETTVPEPLPPEEETPAETTSTDTTTDNTTPPEEPATDPVVSNPTPDAPEQPGDGGSGAETAPTVISDGTVEVTAGRVATLDPAGDVTGVRIVSGVEHGNITVNPDSTFALVMTESAFIGSQSFSYEATHADGSITTHQINLNVTAGTAEHGWATGEAHYMLATDENDRVIVEHGENHQSVYVSGSNSALSLADIAAIEAIPVSSITGSWLASSGYGGTEETALDLDAGMMLWNTLMPRDAADNSNWLLFERGYEYGGYGNLLKQGVDGESGMNPIYIGAWGEGDRPVLQEEIGMYGASNKNVVFQGLHFTEGVLILEAQNIILDDLTLTDDSLVIQEGAGVTVRNSNFYDIYRTHDEANIVDGYWVTSGNYTQGAFIKGIDGLRIEGNFFDLNGWREGYDPNASASGEQPPIMFNHNLYVQRDNMDVSFIDNITMRASLNGAQIRPGGFIENNVYIDNNAAGNFHDSYYTLFTDNLVTSGASKEAPNLGYSAAGMDGSQANMASLVDNIVAHLADPDSNETTWKGADFGYRTTDAYYDDTIVWNWDTDNEVGQANQNTGGLDSNVLNQTTIQEFTAQLLNQPDATIADLAEYLRAQSNGALDDVVDADLIIRFFQEGFGLAADIRTEATTLRFIPDDLGEGVRWDNALNWSTEDRPGEVFQNDSVDLGGNEVFYGSNTTIDTLDLGPGGELNIHGGRLDVTGGLTGNDSGTLDIYGVGQIWADGSDADDLTISVGAGRFANTGLMQNADLTATGGQSILATGGAEFDLSAGHTLAVNGSNAQVGFDGDDGGIAILDMHTDATLAFSAQDGDLGMIAEFRSGALGDQPNVQSGIDLGGATLEIDLAGLSAGAGTAFALMDADEIVGLFDEAVIGGLGAQDARIVIDYETDSVTLELTAGNGAVSVDTIGVETDVTSGEEALWDALTADQGVASETAAATLPAEEDPFLEAA